MTNTRPGPDGGQGFSTKFAEDFLPPDVQDSATTAATSDGPRRARGTDTTEGRMFTVTGGDWDTCWPRPSSSTTNASSSTWVRSTRRPTACCG